MKHITITRHHDICTGHRVYGHEGKCQNLHGHTYRVHFTLEASNLDELGRILDFNVVKDKLCKWLDDNWDHKTLLWFQDPLTEILSENDGVVVVDFNPTAENMADFLFSRISPAVLLRTGVHIKRIMIQETYKCSAEVSV